MEKQIKEFSEQVKRSSDKLMDIFLAVFFTTGLLLSLYYDTWEIGVGVGLLSLTAYYSAKLLLPDSDIYQYVLSAVIGIFMAQFIYQMHGMFEMHFFAFIGSAMLITYRNWKLQIPLAIVVILHHSVFGYLQFIGFEKIYFTQIDYMDLQTFTMHALLTVTIFSLCGLWAYNFKRSDERNIQKSFEIGKLQEAFSQREAIVAMSDNLKFSNERLKAANYELGKIFNTIEEVLFSVDMVNYRVIEMSVACNRIYGYSPIEFIADNMLWKKVIHPDDRHLLDGITKKLAEGNTLIKQYRIIHKNKTVRWLEVKIIPTIDSNGRILRLEGIQTDITQKVILENQLAEEKRRKHKEITKAVITAQENERSFLGEELHDNINPILATAKLYIDSAISNQEMRVGLLKDSKGFISTAMAEIRELSRSLIPPSLGEVSLVEAINDMIVNIGKVHELKFITNWNGFTERLLTDNQKLTIYRVFQEQVNNIIKHAKAKTVSVDVKQTRTLMELHIKDDGVGFDVTEKRNGVGLQNIISRTELHNGKVMINSRPGEGCEIILHFCFDTKLRSMENEIRA